jgi:CO/xanthine dehydrogenase Mo-binding subunit
MFIPYDIPNVAIDAYDVVTNKPKSAPYRAPGAPLVSFVVESVLDQIAESLGVDPVELRLANTAHEGTRRADGTRNPPIGCREVLEAVKSHPHYAAALGPNQGRGVAVGFWRNNTGASSVIVNVVPDGGVGLVTGSVDIGGSRVALALQLAESLGLPVENVHPTVADTDTIGYTSNTSGSGVEFKTGWAVYEAAQDVKAQMRQRAALIWDTQVERVEYDNGILLNLDSPGDVLTFKELAAQMNNTGGPITGRGNLSPRGVGGSAAAAILDVEVDPDTSKIDVVRATAFQDAGRAVHPSYVEGQIQGGTAQGIG